MTSLEEQAFAESFDLSHLPEDFLDDPYRSYRILQDHSPVKRLPDGSVFLTRYDDVLGVYRNRARFSSDKTVEFRPKFGDGLIFEHHTTSLVFNDPPLHTTVREIFQTALGPRVVAAMEPDLINLVDGLLNELETAARPDLIEGFASVIPIEIIGNLLRIPHADRAPLRDWSLRILGALEPCISPEELKAAEAAVAEFLDYLKDLIRDRQSYMLDPEEDLLSRLIIAQKEAGRLSEIELLHNCIFLLNAGHETTTNLIGNGLVALFENTGERSRLVSSPDLIKPAIEELLRFESPNQLGNRLCVEACEISGEKISAGTQITLCIGAANRDPSIFEKPGLLDLSRSPNRHLALGSGHHACLGMTLARLEGKVAIGRFVQRFPHYRIGDLPTRSPRIRFRGFSKIPAQLT